MFVDSVNQLISWFTGAVVAGFLARNRPMLAGLLSAAIPVLYFMLMLVVMYFTDVRDLISSATMNLDAARTNCIYSIPLFLVVGLAGGWVGGRLYRDQWDADIDCNKTTIFGIYWAHYGWIFPSITFMAAVAGVTTSLSVIASILLDAYWLAHPSLWLNWRWLLLLFHSLTFPYLLLAVFLWTQFLLATAMQHNEGFTSTWDRIFHVVVTGFAIPGIVYKATHLYLAYLNSVLGDSYDKTWAGFMMIGISTMMIWVGKDYIPWQKRDRRSVK